MSPRRLLVPILAALLLVAGSPTGAGATLNGGLNLRNVDGGKDWAKVGEIEPGSDVRLFRIHDNGRRSLVRRDTAGDLGQKIFILPDPARRHVRTFHAVVRSPDGERGVTARESIR